MATPVAADAGDAPTGNAAAQSISAVSDDLVQAALRASRTLGKDVADVPVIAIAREAGISRSTLIRRLGGSRTALDEAVRATGVDPGGQVPVRTRALNATAELISTSGLAAATLDAVALHAQCSLNSLYATFGGRDELLRAVFERHSPLLDIEDFFDTTPGDLRATVHQFYRLLATVFSREPRVAPALLADALARPHSTAAQDLLQHNAPRVLATIGVWLTREVHTGHLKDLPLTLLTQQLLAPVVMHMLMRPATTHLPGFAVPDVDTVCATFTDTFLSAAAIPGPGVGR